MTLEEQLKLLPWTYLGLMIFYGLIQRHYEHNRDKTKKGP